MQGRIIFCEKNNMPYSDKREDEFAGISAKLFENESILFLDHKGMEKILGNLAEDYFSNWRGAFID